MILEPKDSALNTKFNKIKGIKDIDATEPHTIPLNVSIAPFSPFETIKANAASAIKTKVVIKLIILQSLWLDFKIKSSAD